MKKNKKIIISLIVGLVVIIGVFAMTKIDYADLMGASVLQTSGSACRKVSSALYKNDLYTDSLVDLGMTWDGVNKCGKRYPSLFKKSLNMTANEDRCSMLRDWLDEGVLSATYSALRIKNNVLSQCAQQFRDIWFDENIDENNSDGGNGNNNNYSATSETCQLLKQWRSQGDLTPNMQGNGMGWNLIADCSNAFPGIFQNGTSGNSGSTIMSNCQALRNWLDATSLSSVSGQIPNLGIMQVCARDYSGIWNNTRRNQGNDYATVSRNNCQLYKNWMNQSALTPNFQAFGLSLPVGDRIKQCQASFPDIMGVQPQPQPVAGPTCETIAQWVRQGVLTPSLQRLGLDFQSTTRNCGNSCLYRMPTTNNETCDNMSLWLKQNTLTANLQSKNIGWSAVTNCGLFCMNNYSQGAQPQPQPQPQPTANPTCETVAQWTKQRSLSANLSNLGLDFSSTVRNCGNSCLYRMPTTNNETCNSMALWLRQNTLTANLQSKNMDWNAVTNCGLFCMGSY